MAPAVTTHFSTQRCALVHLVQRSVWAKDHALISASFLNVRVKRDGELSTDHRLLGCNSRLERPTESTPGLHKIRPARIFSVAENVAKARLWIITCPFRISSNTSAEP